MSDGLNDVFDSALGKSNAIQPSIKQSSGVTNPGNVRPAGKSEGFQKFGTAEEGISAMDKNLQAYGEKHGINTLSGVINRWAPPSENDTQSYISHAAKVLGITPDQKIDLSDPVQRHAISTAIMLHEQGAKKIFGKSSQPQVEMAQPSSNDEYGLNEIFDSAIGKTVATKQIQPAAEQKSSQDIAQPKIAEEKTAKPNIREQLAMKQENAGPLSSLGEVAANIGTGTLGQIAGGLHGLYKLATTGDINKAAQAVEGTANALTYQPRTQSAQLGSEVVNLPLQKATEAAKAAGQVLGGNAGEAIAGAAVPIAATLAFGKAALSPKSASVKEVTPIAEKVHEELPKRESNLNAGAAQVQANPHPKLTGEELVRGEYGVVKPSKIANDVEKSEQAARAKIASEILGENDGGIRTGVITGNEDTLRTEHTAAKSSNATPAAQALREKITQEQNALSQFAENRVKATGANENFINDYQRGQFLNDTIAGDEGLSGYIKNAKNEIYAKARETAGDNPIATTHVDDLFNDPQFKAGSGLTKNEGVVASAEKLIDLAKTTGFKDRAGNVIPANSVAAWDAVRKSLNASWTKDNAPIIREINSAIDRDIAATGGSELYKFADSIHKAEKTMFSSKGIKDVFGEIDPNGVPTGVDFNHMAKKLNDMPIDQWRHIYNVLDSMSNGKMLGAPEGMPPLPKELVDAAKQGKAEMAGMLAREVHRAGAKNIGVWNQNAANNVLNSVIGQKIKDAMPIEEQAKFHTLNLGGQIMPGVHSYEGAGQQAHRMAGEPGLIEKHAAKTGATIGGIASGGPIGAFIGGKLGEKLSERSAIARGEKLRSQLESKMQENAALAKKSKE